MTGQSREPSARHAGEVPGGGRRVGGARAEVTHAAAASNVGDGGVGRVAARPPRRTHSGRAQGSACADAARAFAASVCALALLAGVAPRVSVAHPAMSVNRFTFVRAVVRETGMVDCTTPCSFSERPTVGSRSIRSSSEEGGALGALTPRPNAAPTPTPAEATLTLTLTTPNAGDAGILFTVTGPSI